MEYIGIIITALLASNFVLGPEPMGICPFLGVSKKTNSAVGMGLAVTLVMTLVSLITYPLYNLLVLWKIDYLYIIVFIFVIAAIVQMIEMVLKKFIPGLYSALGIYLPLVTTNCAVLGVAQYVTVMAAEKAVTDLFGAVLYGFAGGLGFLLAIVLLSGIREKLDKLNIPKALKGFPITMIAACFMSMAFSVFIGIKF